VFGCLIIDNEKVFYLCGNSLPMQVFNVIE
jgi:hypothetical protein